MINEVSWGRFSQDQHIAGTRDASVSLTLVSYRCAARSRELQTPQSQGETYLTTGSNSPWKGRQPILLGTASSPENFAEVLPKSAGCQTARITNSASLPSEGSALCIFRLTYTGKLTTRFPAIRKESPHSWFQMCSLEYLALQYPQEPASLPRHSLTHIKQSCRAGSKLISSLGKI